MKSKMEQLLEHIVSDNIDAADELFHNIVVEKSREIYNEMMAEEELNEFGDEDQSADFEQDIEADHAGMDMHDVGADEGDVDADADAGAEFGDEGGEEGELEDRVVDLESALDELKAEFDRLMSDEADEPEHADLGGDDADMGGDFGGEDEGEDDVLSFGDEEEDENMVREYVEKVAMPSKTETNVNAKSVVAGKNDMGGSTSNMAKGGSVSAPDGTSAPKSPKVGDFTMGANDPRAAAKGAFVKKVSVPK